jgi:hypothetical protein
MPQVLEKSSPQTGTNLRSEVASTTNRSGEIQTINGASESSKKEIVYKSPNPEDGKITVYGQLHERPESSIATLLSTGEKQAEILQKMLKDKILHHFVEGHEIDLTPEQKALYIKTMNEDITTVFPDGLKLNELNDRQKLFLAKNGAAEIYQALVPASTLHKTITMEDDKILKAGIQERIKNPDEMDKFINDFNEKCTGREIANFMKTHPGERVGLEYGAGHIWGPDDFPVPAHAPTIEVYTFSRSNSPDQNSIDLANAKTLEEKQKIIDRSKSFDEGVLFCAGNETQAREVFKKTVVDLRDYPEARHYKDAVLFECERNNWKNLAADVNKAFESKGQPFSQFEIDKSAVDAFKKLATSEDRIEKENAMILAQTHIPTQNAMIQLAEKISPLSMSGIYDTYGQHLALNKLDLSYFERMVKEGKFTKEDMTEHLHYLIGGAFPPKDDPYYLSQISEYQKRKFEYLQNEFEHMFKEKDGPLAFLK